MQSSIDPFIISNLHKNCIVQWKSSGICLQQKDFYRLVEENHAFNFQLWHAEDKARRNDKGYEFVFNAKREIDSHNQQRNNRMEAMDEWLFHYLQPEKSANCPVNSESPGMMIDRLSILSLKSYHMMLQKGREDADESHKIQCTYKLEVIQYQLDQLTLCLQQLLDEIKTKKRTFKIYHQFKMYNDPKLNPELYGSE